jgi:hypothetical protein
MNNATPLGLGPKTYTGLNRPAQMLQGEEEERQLRKLRDHGKLQESLV